MGRANNKMPSGSRFNRLHNAHMQVSQLDGRGRRRRAHQQILGALVHREQRDFAQVLRPADQHHHPVDTGSHTAMRRRAILERAVEAAETLLHVGLAQARHFEGFDHQIRVLVANRSRCDLKPVAHQIVLERLDGQRILGVQRLHPALRHAEGVVRELDFLGVFVPFVEREIDDPREAEGAYLDEPQMFGAASACRAGQLGGLFFFTGGDEQPGVLTQTQFGIELFHALLPVT